MTRDQLLLELKPIRTVESVSEFLSASQFWMLALIFIFILLIVLIKKPWRRYSQQRTAMNELNLIHQHWSENGDAHAFSQSISKLLRRYALLKFPQEKVAGLSGKNWLKFLDKTGGDGFFCSDAGKVLLVAPYNPAVSIAPARILTAVRKWIRVNK